MSLDGGADNGNQSPPLVSVSSEAGTITLLVPSTPSQAAAGGQGPIPDAQDAGDAPHKGRALVGQGSMQFQPMPGRNSPPIQQAMIPVASSGSLLQQATGRPIVKGEGLSLSHVRGL